MGYIKLANNISVAKGFVRIAREHPILELLNVWEWEYLRCIIPLTGGLA